MSIEHRDVFVGGVRLHVATCGRGEPVLLLHGFPDFWYGWREQMQALAGEGFLAIAPDLRGYNDSDKPPRIGDYRAAFVVNDLRGLLDALGHDRVHVVGHDWGGILAYCLADVAPERVHRLVIVNGVHPDHYRRKLLGSDQLLRSWYVLFALLPLVPEFLIRQRAVLEYVLGRLATSRSAFSSEDLAAYVDAMRKPGAAKSAFDYYRASFRYPIRLRRPIAADTLVLWGDRDPALGVTLTSGLERYVPRARVVRFAGGGHFLHRDEPAEVSRRIRAFLGADSSRGT